ncbi:MAG: hypothetical protein IJR18_00045 [Campylobacter sp.]|nr:hypothetical protein [Campylobacter sp.]
MFKKFCLFSIFFAIFLSGCGAKGARFDSFVETESKNSATVYVYRLTRAMGALVRFTAYYDNGDGEKEIGMISNGAYAKAEIPANKKTQIYIAGKGNGGTIIPKAGEIYCFKYGLYQSGEFYSAAGWLPNYGASIYMVDLETCKREIKRTRLHSK